MLKGVPGRLLKKCEKLMYVVAAQIYQSLCHYAMHTLLNVSQIYLQPPTMASLNLNRCVCRPDDDSALVKRRPAGLLQLIESATTTLFIVVNQGQISEHSSLQHNVNENGRKHLLMNGTLACI